MNAVVMNQPQTCDYIYSCLIDQKRLVVLRFGDGEYLVMKGYTNEILDQTEDPVMLNKLLSKTLMDKRIFLTIPYAKPHNIENKDIWFQAQQYLIEKSGQELYGCSNWNVFDFTNECRILPLLFRGKVLLWTAFADQAERFFSPLCDITIFQAPETKASSEYGITLKICKDICSHYDNILFSMGPVGKVIITDLVDHCTANLIDFGSLVNAFLGLTDKWTMSWAQSTDLNQCIERFRRAMA
jgi:hypothetical protein